MFFKTCKSFLFTITKILTINEKYNVYSAKQVRSNKDASELTTAKMYVGWLVETSVSLLMGPFLVVSS